MTKSDKHPTEPDLYNFFVDCMACGYTMRFDYNDQVRECPKCGRPAGLSPAYQEHLKKQRWEILQKLTAMNLI